MNIALSYTNPHCASYIAAVLTDKRITILQASADSTKKDPIKDGATLAERAFQKANSAKQNCPRNHWVLSDASSVSDSKPGTILESDESIRTAVVLVSPSGAQYLWFCQMAVSTDGARDECTASTYCDALFGVHEFLKRTLDS